VFVMRKRLSHADRIQGLPAGTPCLPEQEFASAATQISVDEPLNLRAFFLCDSRSNYWLESAF
jgi:hypothetical protein